MSNHSDAFVKFLVKFDLGYYAKKQPYYEWSYTDDYHEARMYSSMKEAEKRLRWGLSLVDLPGRPRPTSGTIEKFAIRTIMEKM